MVTDGKKFSTYRILTVQQVNQILTKFGSAKERKFLVTYKYMYISEK